MYFRYGLCLDWSDYNEEDEENDGRVRRLVETAVLFSPMIKSNTLSPHFYFSKFRHPYIGDFGGTTFLPFSKFSGGRIKVERLEHPISFLTNFFDKLSQDRQNYTLKNKTLSLLSKQQKRYSNLTDTEKKINLKFYGLHRDFYKILEICRPPLLFYVKRKFETDGTTRERVKYEHFFIEYNWKLFTISVKGKTEKLKFILLVSSLY